MIVKNIVINLLLDSETLEINESQLISVNISHDNASFEVVNINKNSSWINRNIKILENNKIIFQGFVSSEPTIKDDFIISVSATVYFLKYKNILSLSSYNLKKLPFVFGQINECPAVNLDAFPFAKTTYDYFNGDDFLFCDNLSSFPKSGLIYINYKKYYIYSEISENKMKIDCNDFIPAGSILIISGIWTYNFCGNQHQFSRINTQSDYFSENNLIRFDQMPICRHKNDQLNHMVVNFDNASYNPVVTYDFGNNYHNDNIIIIVNADRFDINLNFGATLFIENRNEINLTADFTINLDAQADLFVDNQTLLTADFTINLDSQTDVFVENQIVNEVNLTSDFVINFDAQADLVVDNQTFLTADFTINLDAQADLFIENQIVNEVNLTSDFVIEFTTVRENYLIVENRYFEITCNDRWNYFAIAFETVANIDIVNTFELTANFEITTDLGYDKLAGDHVQIDAEIIEVPVNFTPIPVPVIESINIDYIHHEDNNAISGDLKDSNFETINVYSITPMHPDIVSNYLNRNVFGFYYNYLGKTTKNGQILNAIKTKLYRKKSEILLNQRKSTYYATLTNDEFVNGRYSGTNDNSFRVDELDIKTASAVGGVSNYDDYVASYNSQKAQYLLDPYNSYFLTTQFENIVGMSAKEYFAIGVMSEVEYKLTSLNFGYTNVEDYLHNYCDYVIEIDEIIEQQTLTYSYQIYDHSEYYYKNNPSTYFKIFTPNIKNHVLNAKTSPKCYVTRNKTTGYIYNVDVQINLEYDNLQIPIYDVDQIYLPNRNFDALAQKFNPANFNFLLDNYNNDSKINHEIKLALQNQVNNYFYNKFKEFSNGFDTAKSYEPFPKLYFKNTSIKTSKIKLAGGNQTILSTDTTDLPIYAVNNMFFYDSPKFNQHSEGGVCKPIGSPLNGYRQNITVYRIASELKNTKV